MPGYYSESGPATSHPGRIEDYEASLSSYMGYSVEGSLDTNPLYKGVVLPTWYALDDSELVDAKTAREEVSRDGLQLTIPNEGMRRGTLNVMKYLKNRETFREQVFRSRTGALTTVAGLASALAGSAVDPLNIASAFIPVIAPMRYAKLAEQAGGWMGRAALGARYGALEGAVQTAAIEPLNIYGAQTSQSNYSLMDSIANLTFGTILGGGTHAIGVPLAYRGKSGAVPGVGPPSGVTQLGHTLPEDQKLQLIQEPVARAEAGLKAGNVEDAVIDALEKTSGVRVSKAELRKALSVNKADEAEADRIIAAASGKAAPPQTLAGKDFLKTINRTVGGIRLRDADGNMLPRSPELWQALQQSHRYMVNNKKGKTLGEVEEILRKKGYLAEGESALELIVRAAKNEDITPTGKAGAEVAEAQSILAKAGAASGDAPEVVKAKLVKMWQDERAAQISEDVASGTLDRDAHMQERAITDEEAAAEARIPEPETKDPVLEIGEKSSESVAAELKAFSTDKETVAKIVEELPIMKANIDDWIRDGSMSADEIEAFEADSTLADRWQDRSKIFEAAAACAFETDG